MFNDSVMKIDKENKRGGQKYGNLQLIALWQKNNDLFAVVVAVSRII